jgi:hypothetical protein
MDIKDFLYSLDIPAIIKLTLVTGIFYIFFIPGIPKNSREE